MCGAEREVMAAARPARERETFHLRLPGERLMENENHSRLRAFYGTHGNFYDGNDATLLMLVF